MDIENQGTWAIGRNVPIFKTSNDFSMYIEKMAVEQGMSHVESVLAYCEEHMIEPATIAPKINQSLKQKLEQDFRDLNFLPKQPKLDV